MANEERKRLTPVTNTNRELYLYSGNQCAFPNCIEVLLKPNGTWNCQAAHIYVVERDAARGEHALTNEQLRDPSNLVLMCPNHHTEIDNKALEGTYTVECVQQMKADHEARFRTALVSLDRIIDSTVGTVVRRPQNLCALEGFCDGLSGDEKREKAALAAPFVDALERQPPALRDIITLVLVHGRPSSAFRGWGSAPVAAPVPKIEAAAQIPRDDLRQRAKTLQNDGFIAIEEDEGLYYLVLVDPTAESNGWDLFASIQGLAGGDRAVIERVVNHLDFTVLDA